MATVTVLNGPERRRRWSSREKARIVTESLSPGATVAEVARRQDVHPNLLHHWRRQAKRAADGGGGLNFLPVASAPPVGDPGSLASGTIEIELCGAVRVRVDARVDEASLGRVLRALGAAGR